MTAGGGNIGSESTDGRTLYYTNLYGALFAKPLSGGQEQKLIDYVNRGFAVVNDGIFYDGRVGKDRNVPLLFYDFASRSSRELTRISAPGETGMGLTVSPDRKTVLYYASLVSGHDLMLIDPFR
jgi:hypothetical protein